MRYLTNQLGWQTNRLTDRTWVDHRGDTLDSKFSFGGSHDWQSPKGFRQMFASETLTVETASLWLARDQFTSLVSGAEAWTDFLSSLLGLDITMHRFIDDDPDRRFQLSEDDIVLRIGYACAANLPEKWGKRFIEDLPDRELIKLLEEEPDLIRFYLHFIRDFKPTGATQWDAGL